MRAARTIMSDQERLENERYWARILLTVEIGGRPSVETEQTKINSFEKITEAHVTRVKKLHRIY